MAGGALFARAVATRHNQAPRTPTFAVKPWEKPARFDLCRGNYFLYEAGHARGWCIRRALAQPKREREPGVNGMPVVCAVSRVAQHLVDIGDERCSGTPSRRQPHKLFQHQVPL